MLADWETNTVRIADTLELRYPAIVRQLEAILAAHGIPLEIVPDTKDFWILDAAPVQVSQDAFVQFTYKPDYLRDEHSKLITGPEAFEHLPGIEALENSDLVIDGGNVVGVQGTALLTDKAYRENRGWARKTLRAELRRLLRADRLIIVPKEPYDVIDHADGSVRFVDNATVVMNDYSKVDPGFEKRLTAVLEWHGLTIVRIPYRPDNARTNGIDSAVGNYANFLRVLHLIVIPAYGRNDDAVASRILQTLCCPKANVVQLPSTDLARGGGVLQCVTWTAWRANKTMRND